MIFPVMYAPAVLARLIASAATSPAGLYPQGDGAEAFRRTVSRLAEMQGEDYLIRGHAIHGLS